ncbi:DUF2537 domain-containing protein [Mycolicibacterium sp. 018/SC-01/001]|uniref:DUF2537 domain-containing protein n=1 Tax=Mycolicibacterium sp. 018/SC-01/001 TaxID=2592069 RepID=UPI0011801763|nr:DUF2537 domain-containing protein [Mycolicibacterium sp. 018/SC-01/001]TRW82156.1 DUF2537 domain-containing protein [Mycolicibacterium sp. 018/SC-01/001]
MSNQPTPWGTGLTFAAFVAAVLAAVLIVLGVGLMRVNPLLAIGLNLVAVGGLAPTVWGWRTAPVWRWFVLGAAVGVAGAWIGLLALAAAGTYT